MRKVSAEEVLNDIYFDDISAEARELAKRYGYLPYMVQRYIDMLGIEE
ncbi:MAG TPA: RsmB/NOP family class I SAM-dependent RNA methyltransferase, partial [Ignisphaera sp.]|nr:RsmB/NOP family class I SAM-dependent RNA methyltransferase [Ignisphaera sp.]